MPYRLAGRKGMTQGIVNAFDLEYRDPSLTSIFIGARGTGKTALLSYLGTEAKQRDWIVVDTVARAGMLEDIFQQSIDAAGAFVEPPAKKRLTALSLANIGAIEWENVPTEKRNWRGRVGAILDELAQQGKGLLITVDEVDPAVTEVAELITVYQLFVRENRRVALLLAGLPGKVSALLSKDDITFIRRAKQYRLGSISRADVMEAFQDTVTTAGRTIAPDALAAAACAIDGFAYMIQAVGYRAWEQGKQAEISLADVEAGVKIAAEEMRDGVLESTYLDLSRGDKVFLAAMLPDDVESAIADILERTGKSSNSVQKTKRRLIDLGVIGERGRGFVAFELPFFKEFLADRLPTD